MVLQKGYSGIFISSPGRTQIKKRTQTKKQTESWESFIKYLAASTKDIALTKEHKQAVGLQGPTHNDQNLQTIQGNYVGRRNSPDQQLGAFF